MGHAHMGAQAIDRIGSAGYLIDRVIITLGGEEYLQQKIDIFNKGIEEKNQDIKNQKQMFKVAIPTKERVEFVRAAILQGKQEGLFEQDLNIDYSAERPDVKSAKDQGRKIFRVFGVDAAEAGDLDGVDHAVVVTRDEELPEWLTESHTEDKSVLIVHNNGPSSTYSSSKTQNGAYHMLATAAQKRFRELHKSV